MFGGAVIGATATIGAALISNPSWLRGDASKKPDQKVSTEQDQKVSAAVNTTTDTQNYAVRKLEPLETGKQISELPNSVYFFGSSFGLEKEIKDQKRDWINVSGARSSSSFEVQKVEGRYYLIGFIGDESFSQIGSLSTEKPIYTVIFPSPWGNIKKVIGIPFDSIYSIRERQLDIDQSKIISAFDIGFREAITNISAHELEEA